MDQELRKAERQGEISQLQMLMHWATLHDRDITVEDLDHILTSLAQFPDQPLARETLKALDEAANESRNNTTG